MPKEFLIDLDLKQKVNKRLAYLRKQIEQENISTSEILELQSLSQYIDPSDTLLLEWAGVPEYCDQCMATPCQQE